MKALRRSLRGEHGYVLRERRVERLGGTVERRTARSVDRAHLPDGVDARVRAARYGEAFPGGKGRVQSVAHGLLDGALVRLAGPAAKPRPVVLERESEQHRAEDSAASKRPHWSCYAAGVAVGSWSTSSR